ncbi:thiS family protein [bacterium BMS3Abin14]|nr:thiS family protein [bacterium BMS3Abin14]
MRVTIKLFATFRNGRFKIEERDYPPATRAGAVIEQLQIPAAKVGILFLNHRHVDENQELSEGDTLAIFPLLGGG